MTIKKTDSKKKHENPKIPTVKRNAVAARTSEIMSQEKCGRDIATAKARAEIDSR